ncbi:hypothetical protein GCM10025858_08150 [Alicyclobacillus sacchari]|uniref:hypothetical protein n=1 Tax=Alicyclobacillus sacchari TaxID=392010 RepID=UPI0023E92B66|nr:hypothetical protein [Alicyclobacillus sacchari]GMA56312.1 hypothetical protein GCM10025858_08150 [Alicyclobacillus sacchari]
MKVSYQWLSDYVNLADVSPQALADKLTSAGLAVDAVEPRNKGVSGVVVGEIVSAEQHPNADRLRVCMVDALRANNCRLSVERPTRVRGCAYP